MCRKGAWIELTVRVTLMVRIQSRALGIIIGKYSHMSLCT